MLWLTGRMLIVLVLAGIVLGWTGAGPGGDSAASEPARMTAAAAHEAALAGTLVLIDIRTVEEWRASALPASGHAISMHQDRDGFLRALELATGGDKSRPVALICAVGNRSASLQAWLTRAGYTAVVDVAEGMIGGRRGPGWIRSGLPVRPWSVGATAPPTAAR